MTIEIACFRVHWTLNRRADAELAEAALARLMDEKLDAALAGVLFDSAPGVGGTELVAVRSVVVPPVVVRGIGDASAWAGQVSAAVAATIAAGGPDVVRYRTTAAAVLDIARGVAFGDRRREWAWRQLGVWPAADPAVAVTDLLAAHPPAVVPVLDAVGAALPALLDLLGTDGLRRLVGVQWGRLGAVAEGFGNPASQHTSGSAAPGSRSEPAPPAVTAAGRAALARPLGVELTRRHAGARASSAADQPPPPRESESARLIAALLVGHTDPAAVAAGLGAVRTDELLQVLRAPDALSDGVTAGTVPEELVAGSERSASSTGRPDGVATVDRSASTSGSDGAVIADIADSPTGPYVRRRTEWAGLICCLHPLRALLDPTWRGPMDGTVVPDAGLDRLVAVHGWPVVLHATGRTLLQRAGAAQVGPDDPALLAFCGLAPDAAAPDTNTHTDTHTDIDTDPTLPAAGLADDIVAALRVRLAGRGRPPEGERELLRTVLRRTGWVSADPGWLVVALDLAEVSVEIRGAGLDLDPGWLPALGCVVRFDYG